MRMNVETRQKLAEQVEMTQLMLDDTMKVLDGLCGVQAGTIDQNDEPFWIEMDMAIARIQGSVEEWRTDVMDVGNLCNTETNRNRG